MSGILLVYLLHCALDRSCIRLMPVVLFIFFNLTAMVLAQVAKFALIGLAGLYYIRIRGFLALTTAVVAFAAMLDVMQIIHLVRAPKYWSQQ